MKKKVLALLLVAAMAMGMLVGCSNDGDNNNDTSNNQPAASNNAGADNNAGGDSADANNAGTSDLEVLTQFGDLSADDAEYDPNTSYDKYTVIDYYIEDADATVRATVSAKADDSEYYLEYSFYGDDQLVICDHDGNVSEDKTGFMAGTTPDMIQYIQANAVWSAMPDGSASAGGSSSEGGLEVLTQFGDLTADDAEYDPNPDYDKYTVIDYYIEDADATVRATVSAKADESEYYLEYSFYGDDQLVICDHDGNVSEDKTGFMAGTTPDMIQYIQANAVWSAIPQ